VPWKAILAHGRPPVIQSPIGQEFFRQDDELNVAALCSLQFVAETFVFLEAAGGKLWYSILGID
jgi:hypothetical protein